MKTKLVPCDVIPGLSRALMYKTREDLFLLSRYALRVYKYHWKVIAREVSKHIRTLSIEIQELEKIAEMMPEQYAASLFVRREKLIEERNKMSRKHKILREKVKYLTQILIARAHI